MRMRSWAFVCFMLVLMAAFVALGIWQVQRLGEKEALIAAVEERYDAEPVEFMPLEEWDTLDPASLQFQPVDLTGTFRDERSVRIFTSLSASTAQGPVSGPGYWIITPFGLETGGTVLVNRGFVPEAEIDAYMEPGSTPDGVITITGVLRVPEEANIFTPEPDADRRIAWVRDPEQLAELTGQDLAPYAPMTVDQAANPAGGLPQGGETVIEFPNNHLGYAITWFGFALIMPFLLFAWVWRQRRLDRA